MLAKRRNELVLDKPQRSKVTSLFGVAPLNPLLQSKRITAVIPPLRQLRLISIYYAAVHPHCASASDREDGLRSARRRLLDPLTNFGQHIRDQRFMPFRVV